MTDGKFSPKQMEVLGWWMPSSEHCEKQAIICDGAVRSGKTFSLSLSFLLWSFLGFDGMDFAICGKTIMSLQRNVVNVFTAVAREFGLKTRVVISRNLIEVSSSGRTNRYHLFGGKDEGSAALIQGMTLAGAMFDEVALMPRSFVEQALARCSVEGARFWFNCNPDHPGHWFYNEWIKKTDEKNVLYLHFLMEDNPSLSKKVVGRYQKLYSGVFYERYILGKWTAAHGVVYPMFNEEKHVVGKVPENLERFIISCDYGTVNPSSFGLWGYSADEDCWYRIREYYHSSKSSGVIKTDEQYCDDLIVLAGGLEIETVIVDPSAASFIQALRNRGMCSVVTAQNRVIDGIRLVSGKLDGGKLKVHESCRDIIREFGLYRWDSRGGDEPCKENDHAMDDVRYFVAHVFAEKQGGFFAVAKARG